MSVNPMDWPAGPFLALYAGLAVAMLVLLGWRRRQVGRMRAREDALEGLDAVQLGYLAGGRARAADTVLVGLFEAGAVAAGPRRGNLLASGAAPDSLRAYCGDVMEGFDRLRFRRRLQGRCAEIHGELAARGLVPRIGEIRRFRVMAALLILAVAGFGVCKIDIGAARGHPVGFLVMLVVVAVFLGFKVAMREPYRTQAGRRALARARRAKSRAVRAPLGDEVLLAFALAGMAVLAGRPYQAFFKTANGFGGGDSSGGDSGGDSGGGGGCGGGCGGCS